MTTVTTLEGSIDKGLTFLAQQQLAAGNFECLVSEATYGLNETMDHFEEGDRKGWVSTDNTTVFPATIIGLCLLPAQQLPQAKKILDKIDQFLLQNRKPFDLWNHSQSNSPVYGYLPHDADDTALASHYLRERGIYKADNEEILLRNRTQEGLFYTWFTFRKEWNPSIRYWLSSAKELRHPIISHYFWRETESSRYDLDGIVNNNIIHYLGERKETVKAIQFIIDRVKNKEEVNFDLYYNNPHVIWYFLSKNVQKQLPSFQCLTNLLKERIINTIDQEGRVRNSAMETALALSTLLNLQIDAAEYPQEKMVAVLLKAQSSTGAWSKRVFYSAGRKYIYGWGSEELTTGLALEALTRILSSQMTR